MITLPPADIQPVALPKSMPAPFSAAPRHTKRSWKHSWRRKPGDDSFPSKTGRFEGEELQDFGTGVIHYTKIFMVVQKVPIWAAEDKFEKMGPKINHLLFQIFLLSLHPQYSPYPTSSGTFFATSMGL